MSNTYLQSINKKETNKLLVSLRVFAEQNNVPIITIDGINFINQIIRLRDVKNVLEIGTAIGYSAINMVLNTGVNVTTIERDETMYQLAKENITKAGLESKITLHYADALEFDETLLDNVDLIFIDAAKAQSKKFFTKYEKLLNERGVIITDNLLFHGLVNTQAETANLRQLVRKIEEFNQFVVKKEGYDTYIYEVGDGMSISIKRT